MLELIWVVIGGLAGLFLKETKPHQIALAVAIGLMIGLVPKANLIVLMLVLALFLLRCNLGYGILVAALVSMIMPRIDAMVDQWGTRLLQRPDVADFIGSLFQYPLFAWMSLNNTVVLGSFIMGIVAFFPVYMIVFLGCRLVFPSKKSQSKTEESLQTE